MKTASVKAQISEKKEDTFTAVASTATQDRHGEVVEQEGWDLKSYKQNPILLYMHDHTKPLGKATRIWVDRTSGKAKLMFKGFISDATDYGRAAKQLMDEGILNTFSVGFRIIEMDGNTITKADLHEISLVSVPANPEARRLALKSLEDAGIEDEVIKDFIPDIADEDTDHEEDERDKLIKDLQSQVATLEDKVEIAVKGIQHLAPHRSKRKVAQDRLRLAKIVAKTADSLLADKPSEKTALKAKVIKRTSEMLIRDTKGDL